LNGRHWRAFLLEDKQNGLRIWVGERDDVRADLVDRIVRHTLWPNVLGSLILAAMVWLAIGWGLKPLANMAATLRARHSGSLEPLQLTPLPSELEPMQAALNRMLAQIQEVLAANGASSPMPPTKCVRRWRCCGCMRRTCWRPAPNRSAASRCSS
jgi:two-component system sensor histidine kinase QseC